MVEAVDVIAIKAAMVLDAAVVDVGATTPVKCMQPTLISLIPTGISLLRNERNWERCAYISFSCEKVAAVVAAGATTIALPPTLQ